MSDFQRPVSTPGGPGLLVGIDPGPELVLVSHRTADVTPEVAAGIKGQTFTAWYPMAAVVLLPAAGAASPAPRRARQEAQHGR